MSSDVVDPHARAVAMAESMAKAHAGNGGDVADLFATFVLFVAQEDSIIGMQCLTAVSLRYFGSRAVQNFLL
jgi:hypothetical protein